MTKEEKISRWEFLKTTELMVQRTIDEFGYDPLELSFGSHKKAWFKCSECSWEWLIILKARIFKSCRCPNCYKKNRSDIQKKSYTRKSKKSINETHPDLCRELLDPGDSLKYTYGSHKKVWWKCSKCTYVWKSAISYRTRRKQLGCPSCSGQIVTDLNCLRAVNPSLASELVDPELGLKYTYGSEKKVLWRCPECSLEYLASFNNRSAGCGCRLCNKQGSISRKEQEFINNFVKLIPNFSFKKNKKGLYKGQQQAVPFPKPVNNRKVAFIDFAIKHPKLSRIFLLEYDEKRHRYNADIDTTRQKEVYNILKKKYETVTIIRVPEDDENKLETIINEFSNFLNNDNYKELVEFPKDIWN